VTSATHLEKMLQEFGEKVKTEKMSVAPNCRPLLINDFETFLSFSICFNGFLPTKSISNNYCILCN
jgi:hypothetical protein